MSADQSGRTPSPCWGAFDGVALHDAHDYDGKWCPGLSGRVATCTCGCGAPTSAGYWHAWQAGRSFGWSEAWDTSPVALIPKRVRRFTAKVVRRG